MRQVERIQKYQLGWLNAHVDFNAEWDCRPQVAAFIQRFIDAYDDMEKGYVVEYHRKVFNGNAAGRKFAS
jgi:hypothetical protein